MLQQPVCIITKQTCQTIPILHSVLRTRGGGNGKELTNDFDNKIFEVPVLSKAGFMWDGYPSIEFQENVLTVLRNGLMSTGDKDATLFTTAEKRDPGGELGNPAAATLDANVAAEKLIIDGNSIRKLKLFGVLCNYTNPKSETYRMFFRDFNSDGPAVWSYIKAYGPLPMPSIFIRAREDVWKQLTYERLKCPFNVHGLFKYVDTILHLARKLNKDGHACKSKFIEGLPSFMQHAVSAMRHENTAVFPALYGGKPMFNGTPLAATAHPLAGQPDIATLARNFLEDFILAASRSLHSSPDSLLMMCDPSDNDVVMLASGDVTPKTKCFYCTGLGHSASCNLPDGTRVVCASKVLGHPAVSDAKSVTNDASADDLLSLKSLEGHISTMSDSISDLRDQMAAFQTTSNTARNSRKGNFRRNDRMAHELQDSGVTDDEYDDDSVGSEMPDMSAIQDMADAYALPSSSRPFKRRGSHSPRPTRASK